MARQMMMRINRASSVPNMIKRRKLEPVPRGDDFTSPAGKLTVTGADACGNGAHVNQTIP